MLTRTKAPLRQVAQDQGKARGDASRRLKPSQWRALHLQDVWRRPHRHGQEAPASPEGREENGGVGQLGQPAPKGPHPVPSLSVSFHTSARAWRGCSGVRPSTREVAFWRTTWVWVKPLRLSPSSSNQKRYFKNPKKTTTRRRKSQGGVQTGSGRVTSEIFFCLLFHNRDGWFG